MKTKYLIALVTILSLGVYWIHHTTQTSPTQAHCISIFCNDADIFSAGYNGTGSMQQYAFAEPTNGLTTVYIAAMHIHDAPTKIITEFSPYIDTQIKGVIERDLDDRSLIKVKLNLDSEVDTEIKFLGIHDRSEKQSDSEGRTLKFSPGVHDIEFAGKILSMYTED